ncbi:MAG TPA: YihY/virulence factor BrkB family protein [Candidatus Limnocylindrales bacterium]|nr:YihY/virulence factor BrkB family protein [Candidatus Limnocylindrales bacterium]
MAPAPRPDLWRRLGNRFLHSIVEDDVSGLSAEIAYRFLFAVFPFGLFVAALGSFVAMYFGIANPADDVVQALRDNLPPSIAEAIRPELQHLLSSARPDLVSLGALAALWAATGGVNAVVKGMHRAYDVDEIRPFLMRYVVAVGLTLVGAIVVIGSFVTIVGGAALTEQIAQRVGLGDVSGTLLSVLRWPVIFAVLTASVAILYRYGPSVAVPWRWIFAGAATFAAGWLIATAALGFYVGHVADYGATYGSLGAVIVLMTWFYVTAALLIVGAEVTATLAHELTPDAIHRRGAEQAVAETVHGATDEVRDGVERSARRITS